MPTHNRPKLLQDRSIPSVLGQTFQNWELLIRGDGADERTESVINSFNDPRIKYKNLPRRLYSNPREQYCWGGGYAVNDALEGANGKYIAYLDDDDEFLPHHLKTLSEMLLSGNYDLVYGRAYHETPDAWKILGDSFDKDRLMRQNFIAHCTVMYDRPRLGHFRHEIGYPLEPLDWVMWKKMVNAGARVGFTKEVVAIHYIEAPFRSRESEFLLRVEQIRRMVEIQSSFTYRFTSSITSKIDMIFPNGTRRGRMREKLVARLAKK